MGGMGIEEFPGRQWQADVPQEVWSGYIRVEFYSPFQNLFGHQRPPLKNRPSLALSLQCTYQFFIFGMRFEFIIDFLEGI